jgi:RNA ligase
MVRPFHLGDPDLYQMATKMGFTDTSAQVDRFLKETVDLSSNDRTIHDLIMDCHDAGYTPIFEWCSRKNKIVLDYPQDRLVLIALREMRSGKYYPYDEMLDIAHHNNVDVVRFYKGNIKTIEEMVDDIRQTDDEEGYVLSWENGHKVKIKSDWYVLLHKSKDSIRQEKDVLELILTDKSDDLLPLLDDADKAKIIDYRNSVWEALNIASHSYGSFVTQAKAENVTMKEFALSWVPQLAVPSIAFNIFRGKMNAHDAVVDYCLKQCSSNKKVEALHKFLDIYKKFRYEEKIGE